MPFAMTTGRTYGGRTAEERKAARRAAFLEAGLQLYGTKSYADVTVIEVVEHAGQTRRAFYECFTDREELLRAVDRERVRDRLVAETRVDSAPLPDWPAARDWLRRTLAFYIADPRRAHVAFFAVIGVSKEMEEHRRTNSEALLRGFIALLGDRGGPTHEARELAATGF